MKIFYKKDYLNLTEKYKYAKEKLEEYKEKYGNQHNDNMILAEDNESLREELIMANRKYNSSKGGYTTKINKLEKQLDIASKTISELRSDRYLIKKVRSTKPIRQTMHLRANNYSAQTRNILKEKSNLS